MTEPGHGVSRDARMARHFVTLADTLVDDFDVVDLLDQLTRTCVELLGVTTAGLLILDSSGSLHPVAASTEATRVLELFQLQNDEGPCLDCVRTGEVVHAPDIRAAAGRWPRFSRALIDSGFRSVEALPMRLRSETIGSLNLFNVAGIPPLSDDDRHIAQALADVATIGILQQRNVQRSSVLAEQLQLALDTRIVIEQAKGVLAEYGGVPVDVAFDALRRYARGTNARLGDVAEAIVSGRLPASDLVARRSGRG
jgi:GAF domain-containing protein